MWNTRHMRCVGLRQVMRARDTIHRGGIIGMAREHGNAMGFSEAGRLYGKMFQDSLGSVTLVRYKVRMLHDCTRMGRSGRIRAFWPFRVTAERQRADLPPQTFIRKNARTILTA
jgi:hypothetical protein